MKYALAFVAVFMFAVGQSVGQTLAPVDASSGGFWPFVIIAAVGAAVAVFVIWHKRNPSQADAATNAAKADLIAGWHKAADQVTALTNLARQQAVVIASPPVQAAINAPAQVAAPAPAPTPAPPVAAAPPPPQNGAGAPQATPPAPEATPAPTPAPAPVAAVAPAPAYVPPIVPNTFGITQEEMEAARLAGSASPAFQALWARISAAGGTSQDMNNVINWYDPSGGGYRADHDERFLTDPNANLTAYGLAWNGARWVKP